VSTADALLHALAAELGPAGLLTERAECDARTADLSGLPALRALAVARPATREQVAAVVRLCARSGVPITPRGGGSGLSGGATLRRDGSLLLSFERLRAVREVDPLGLTLTVEAGLTLHEAQQAAAAAGCRLALDHGGAGSSQIGGNLATNAGGHNVLRHGMAREQVLALEVVLADGRLLPLPAPLRKNNAGYDLKQLFIGSEGTLGLITAATLRLRPAAAVRATALLAARTLPALLAAFARAQSALGETLVAAELMPRAALRLQAAAGRSEPLPGAGDWLLLLEAESVCRSLDLDAELLALYETALAAGEITDGVLAASGAQAQALWALREGIAHLMLDHPASLKMDTAVPIAHIVRFVGDAGAAVRALWPAAQALPFGHVGDGNIHFNVIGPPGCTATEFEPRRAALARAIEDCALALGGTVSAEHGIGALKRDALARQRGAAELALMASLKHWLDPQDLLNPGKLLPDAAPGA